MVHGIWKKYQHNQHSTSIEKIVFICIDTVRSLNGIGDHLYNTNGIGVLWYYFTSPLKEIWGDIITLYIQGSILLHIIAKLTRFFRGLYFRY